MSKYKETLRNAALRHDMKWLSVDPALVNIEIPDWVMDLSEDFNKESSVIVNDLYTYINGFQYQKDKLTHTKGERNL